MKISILLPYKENFSPEYAGAVSLFVKDTSNISNFKKHITVFGNTNYKKRYKINYKNLSFRKNFLNSASKKYINEFLVHEEKNPSDLIEIHNRPIYVKPIFEKLKKNIILYYHNDPLSMSGSQSINERKFLLDN